MGDKRGFLKKARSESAYRPVCERKQDFKQVAVLRHEEKSQEQASRCMDCGTPFCHWGCPIGNYIPEWNDLMYAGQWEKAYQLLETNNNLPEITGRLCPATCEYACVLGINDDPVTIRENELAIAEYALEHGLVKSNPPKKRTGKKVAIVGSGPAGLSTAVQLNKAGHHVRVFERDDKIGGILRYGIPDFKLEKHILDRRIRLWKKAGIEFRTNAHIGVGISIDALKSEYDVICLTGGSRVPRDLKIKGRDLKGIHFAMDYLIQSNRRAEGEKIPQDELIDAKDKSVVVIGGGDTGADCVGTAHRQNARCVVQIEVLPQPSECRTDDGVSWPKYPLLLKTSSSHEEGGQRRWAVLTKEFIGNNGRVQKISCVEITFSKSDKAACPVMEEVAGSEFEIEADIVIIAVGFLHPEHSSLLADLKIKFDERGNVKTDSNYMTSADGVFSAGDMRRGQSLVVWAISEGRCSAYYIDKYLMGQSNLSLI
ncbi:glutamate synthase subunit beta [Candidatus Omnitrophota bacterium]